MVAVFDDEPERSKRSSGRAGQRLQDQSRHGCSRRWCGNGAGIRRQPGRRSRCRKGCCPPTGRRSCRSVRAPRRGQRPAGARRRSGSCRRPRRSRASTTVGPSRSARRLRVAEGLGDQQVSLGAGVDHQLHRQDLSVRQGDGAVDDRRAVFKRQRQAHALAVVGEDSRVAEPDLASLEINIDHVALEKGAADDGADVVTHIGVQPAVDGRDPRGPVTARLATRPSPASPAGLDPPPETPVPAPRCCCSRAGDQARTRRRFGVDRRWRPSRCRR